MSRFSFDRLLCKVSREMIIDGMIVFCAFLLVVAGFFVFGRPAVQRRPTLSR